MNHGGSNPRPTAVCTLEPHYPRSGKVGRYFGMKMHNGVDAESGLIHSVVCTAAHEADVVHAHRLLHGQT